MLKYWYYWVLWNISESRRSQWQPALPTKPPSFWQDKVGEESLEKEVRQESMMTKFRWWRLTTGVPIPALHLSALGLLLLMFSHSVGSGSLWPHGLQHARLPCPSPSPGDYANSCPLSQWCYLTISSPTTLSSFAFKLSQHQSLFQWVSSSYQVAKGLEFQLQHQSLQWTFRTDFL